MIDFRLLLVISSVNLFYNNSVMGTVILPGELIEPSSSSGANDKQIIGYGIERLEGDRLVSTQPGILRSTAKKQWISVQARRFVFKKIKVNILALFHSSFWHENEFELDE